MSSRLLQAKLRALNEKIKSRQKELARLKVQARMLKSLSAGAKALEELARLKVQARNRISLSANTRAQALILRELTRLKGQARKFKSLLAKGRARAKTLGENSEDAPAQTPAVPEAFPAVNTPEWDAMNKRRDELIRKENDGVLTPAEREEYERLQRLSLAAVVEAFPRPKPDFEELDRLRKELGATSAPEAE